MSALTTGKLANAAGVGIDTVRFYARAGLIDRPQPITRAQIFPGRISATPKAATMANTRPTWAVARGRCRTAQAARAIRLPPGRIRAIAAYGPSSRSALESRPATFNLEVRQ